MSYCIFCGAGIMKEDIYCPGCGAALKDQSEPSAQPHKTDQTGISGMPAVKKKTPSVMIIGVVAIVVIIAAVILSVGLERSRTAAETWEDNGAVGQAGEGIIWETDIVRDTPTNFVASIEADVRELRFYESGYEDVELADRVYDIVFPKNETRYINWELQLEHPSSDEERSIVIVHKYYRPTGVIEHINKSKYIFPANWTETWQSWGYGYADPGQWARGIYYVEILVDSIVVAAGSFEIY